MLQKIRDFMKLSKTQATVILAGTYIAISLLSNIAATKVTYFGSFVMDAGFIYAIIFTWRDLIHKQLGKKAALTTIYTAGIINILAALYFQLVIYLPPESSWALAGGQSAWKLLFGIQFRIVLGSVIAFMLSELVDTKVYSVWMRKAASKPQWLRVIVSNSFSIPVDSILFPLIAFFGILPLNVIFQMFLTNILVKAIVTTVSFWMIYLVPEKPIYISND